MEAEDDWGALVLDGLFAKDGDVSDDLKAGSSSLQRRGGPSVLCLTLLTVSAAGKKRSACMNIADSESHR